MMTLEQINKLKALFTLHFEQLPFTKNLPLNDVLTLIEDSKKISGILTFPNSEKMVDNLNFDFTNLPENLQKIGNLLLDIDFPVELKDALKAKFMLSEEFTTVIMVEYVKFIILKLKFPLVVPSFLVGIFWEEHFVFSRHFRNTMELLNDSNTTCLKFEKTDDGGNFHDRYEYTLKNYKEVFGHDPNPDVWFLIERENELRESHFYNVNILRLSLYHWFEESVKKEFGKNMLNYETFEDLFNDIDEDLSHSEPIYLRYATRIFQMKSNRSIRDAFIKKRY
jgi:hypothetical protein